MYKLPFDKLNESNYHDWKFQMEALLEEKGLFGIVSGEDVAPTDATAGETKSFLEKQRLARAKIVLALEPAQIPHIRDVTDPAIMWKNLARIHSARGLGVLLTMRMEFLRMTMPSDSSIATWVAKVRHAAYCLEECHRAEEDIPSTSPSIVSNLDKVGVLLNGLPPSYQTVIVSITGTPLSSLSFENVVTRLMNEEGRQRNLLAPVVIDPPTSSAVKPSSTENVAFAAKINQRGTSLAKPGFKAKLKCHKCGGIGHFRQDCPTSDSDAAAAQAAFAFLDDEDFATTAVESEVAEW
jgi:hypothetical protein